MKICSLYGAGFYYMPGTDICLKIGGYVRAQQSYNVNGSQTNGPLANTNLNNRSTNDLTWRARAYVTADARQQTAYGTVRSYMSVGMSGDNAGGMGFSANRAFIQFAGFTVGTAVSFFDFYSSPAVAYFGGKIQPASDTGDAGQFVTAYTAQFGNGLSASISAEAPQQNRQQNVLKGPAAFGTAGTAATAGYQMPDFVANLRVDQAWGSAQLMGAIHRVAGLYYGATEDTGGPSVKYGYALGAGLRLNAPMFGARDYFQTQVNYSEGAIGYNIAGAAFNYGAYKGNTVAWGLVTDGIYSAAAGSTIELTKAWSVNASYEHYWNANWQTSLYGAYVNTKYSTAASTVLCGAGCSASWNYWAVGSRTQWNVNKNFYMGVDIVYSKINPDQTGAVALAANGTKPAGTYQVGSVDAVSAQFRVHRDFGF